MEEAMTYLRLAAAGKTGIVFYHVLCPVSLRFKFQEMLLAPKATFHIFG
jgi:hypothetical protein